MADPPPSPDQGAGVFGTALIMGTALAALVGLRLFLGGPPEGLTAASYEKPVRLDLLFPRPGDEEFPEGWELATAIREARVAELGGVLPGGVPVTVPRPAEVERVLVGEYRDPGGQPVYLVGVDYRRAAPASREDHVQDDALLMCLRPGGARSSALAKVVSSKGARMKRVRVWAEKMKTLGSAYVQFGMDVVVGLLGALLLLFFAKYFLIMRETDGI